MPGRRRKSRAIRGPVEPFEITTGDGLRDFVKQAVSDNDGYHAETTPTAHAVSVLAWNPSQDEHAEKSQHGISREVDELVGIIRRAARRIRIRPVRRQK